MEDKFEATFVVDLSPDEAWEAINDPRLIDSAPEGQRVLPGFPGPRDHGPGALVSELEVEPRRLLRVRKEHEPCSGTEILVTLEEAARGTKITIVQSGFGDWAKQIFDAFSTHGMQIFRDFALYIERGVFVPATAWGTSFGATTRQTPVGLALTSTEPEGFAARAGMARQDLLLTLRGIRIHDTQQLWTVLALSDAGQEVEVSWARAREKMRATLPL